MTQTKRLLIFLIPSLFLFIFSPAPAAGRPTIRTDRNQPESSALVAANGQAAGLEVELPNHIVSNDPNPLYSSIPLLRWYQEPRLLFPIWLRWLLIVAVALLTWLGLLILTLRRQVIARTAELVAANEQLRLKIEERRQIEQTLRENEERLSLAISGTGGALWDILIDPEAGFDEITDEVYMAPEEKNLLGYPKHEPMPASQELWDSHVLPEDRAERLQRQRDHFEGRTTYLDHEYRVRSRDGRIRWIRGRSRIIRDDLGRPIRWIGIDWDVTERKQADTELRKYRHHLEREVEARTAALQEANQKLELEIAERIQMEAALRRSEARYRALFEQANDAIFLNNLNDEITDVNQRACELLGYSREELLQMTIPDIQAPEVRKEVGTAIKYELEAHQTMPFETLDLHRDGTRIPVEVTSAEIGGQDEKLVLSITRDIRERKRAEQALLRRNRELDLFNRIIAASVAGQDQKTILETACRELARAFELPHVAAALAQNDQTETVVVAEERTEEQPSILGQKITLTNNPLAEYLANHKAPVVIGAVSTDPRLAPMRSSIDQLDIDSLIVLPLIIEGELIGSISLIVAGPRQFSSEEINLARRVAEQVSGALARTRLSEKYRLLTAAVEQSSESIMITDKDDLIVYVNPAFERVTGYSADEVMGQSPDILGSGKHSPAFFRELHETINAGQVWQGRITNRRKDSTLFTEEGTISPIRDQTGQIVNYIEVKRDVTQELEREQQYQQAQKMESIGRLTAGIAHDFNNLLTAINGFAELLQLRLPADSPLQDMVTTIINSGQRAANLVRQLMAFSRKQIIDPETIDLNAVVTEMGIMMQRIIGEDIQLRTTLAPDLWLVKVDPAQIEQIIVNLAVNARDAMPAGGHLTIETANVDLDETYSASHIETSPGQYVRLAVSDTGHGIKDALKKYIFEPFFTTKETGKGTGLGLATVYGIVKQNGGDIQVYSEEGVGTTFKIYLPRVTGPAAVLPELEESPEIPRGHETILLVEDDRQARDLVQEVLQERGYILLQAKNGQEAVQLAAEYPQPIHLLLTDVVMPGMSGKALAERLVQSRPRLKILFMSGYTENAIAHHGVLDQGINFIQKPLSPTVLARKVRRVLDQ